MKRFCRIIFCFCMIFAVLSGCAASPLSDHTSTPTVGTHPGAMTNTAPTTEPATVPVTETVTAPITEPTTESTTEPATAPTAEETQPVHIHNFSPATCTNPKTCSTCGKKEGKAAAHSWQDATCLTPKTCTVCGKTSGKTGSHNWQAATCAAAKTCTVCGKTTGSALGHDYFESICKTCGASAPEDATMVWVPTKSGKKYHSKPDCSNMRDPKQITQEEAEEQGFTPCKKCH